MANQEHLEIVLRSAKAHDGMREWNEWRQANLGMVPDLSEANLSKADLSGADLSGATVSGADFHGTDLASARMTATVGLEAAHNFDKAVNRDRLLKQ